MENVERNRRYSWSMPTSREQLHAIQGDAEADLSPVPKDRRSAVFGVSAEMRARLIFAGKVSLVATCALMIGVKVAEAVRMVTEWMR